MQCESAIGDDIDIEEHDIFKNPLLRKIFPDITKLKQELDDHASAQNVETRDWRKTEMKNNGGESDNQSGNATDIGSPHACTIEFDRNITNIDPSSEASADASKEQQFTNNNVESELMVKKEILTCKACSKESEDEMCKECVLESAERLKPYSSTDENRNVDDLTVIDKASEIIFACHICTEYTTVSRSDLEQHLQKHMGGKSYTCDFCNYKCSQRRYLNTHVTIKHFNGGNYSCNYCEYKCGTKSLLTRHFRKHTGEKPFNCDLCDYRTSYSGHLKTHKKARHTN